MVCQFESLCCWAILLIVDDDALTYQINLFSSMTKDRETKDEAHRYYLVFRRSLFVWAYGFLFAKIALQRKKLCVF